MEKKQRNSNIELLRTVAMFMIIAYHIFLHCINIQLTDIASMERFNNGLFNTPVFHLQLSVLFLISPMGNIGNAVFIIISGYFMINKGGNINLGKIAKNLFLQLGFATVAVVLLSDAVYFAEKASGTYVFLQKIDIFNDMSWFIGYYFLTIIIAALGLNKFLLNLSQKQYTVFLAVLFGFIEFVWLGGVLDGFSVGLRTAVTGIFLYSFGAYIQLFNPLERVRTYALILMILIINFLIVLSGYNNVKLSILNYVRSKSTEQFIQNIPQYPNYSVIVIALGIILFELFRRFKMPNNKLVNFLGKSTFTVYLTHDNAFVYNIWDRTDWITILYKQPIMFVIKLLIYILCTFAAGVILYIVYLGAVKLYGKISWLFLKKESIRNEA